MRYLFKNQLRDLFKRKLLFIALFFIVLVGMVFYSGVSSAQNSIYSSIYDFYDRTNLSSYEIKVNDPFKEEEIAKFKEEYKYKYDLAYDAANTYSVDHLYYRDTYNFNKYELVEGTEPIKDNDIIIDYDYAVANNYKVGEYIILGNKAYHIAGLAKFPNHVFKGNYFPDKSTYYIALIHKDNLKYNTIYLDDSLSYEELSAFLAEIFTESDYNLVKTSESFSYMRVENDIKLVNSILNIFPIACFISIIIILYINYNKIIEDQKPYIGVLKANGFKLYKIYFSMLYLPLILVLISSVIGACIGINFVPKYYLKIIDQFYALPQITNNDIFKSIILPVIIVVFATITTITIPLLLTITKTPSDLMKANDSYKFGKAFLRKINISYHFKLIIRNIITTKRKNINLIIASALLLGIVLGVYFVNDSVNYTAQNLAFESFKGDFVLDFKDPAFYENNDIIENDYFYYNLSIKTNLSPTFEEAIIYDNSNSCIYLENDKNEEIDGKDKGIYVPSSYRDYGLEKGDKIKVYTAFDGYRRAFEVNISDFINEKGSLKFALSLQTIKVVHEKIYNFIEANKNTLPRLVELKDGYTTKDLETKLNDNYDFNPKISNFKADSFLKEEYKDKLYTFNFNENYISNKEACGYLDTFNQSSIKTIILNDNLDIVTTKVFEEKYSTLSSDGLYVPKKFANDEHKITFYYDKKTYTFDVLEYIDSNTIYATYEYFNDKNINIGQSQVYYYENIDKDTITSEVKAKAIFTDFNIIDFNLFGKRLDMVNELLVFTKKLASTLATIIFILLVYNIGVIGLNKRIKDIGIFKANGLKNYKLKLLLSVENVLVVLFGSLISILVGFLITKNILGKIYSITSINIVLKMNVVSIITIIIFSLLLILITSYFINRKINKFVIANIVKGSE